MTSRYSPSSCALGPPGLVLAVTHAQWCARQKGIHVEAGLGLGRLVQPAGKIHFVSVTNWGS